MNRPSKGNRATGLLHHQDLTSNFHQTILHATGFSQNPKIVSGRGSKAKLAILSVSCVVTSYSTPSGWTSRVRMSGCSKTRYRCFPGILHVAKAKMQTTSKSSKSPPTVFLPEATNTFIQQRAATVWSQLLLKLSIPDFA